MNYPIHSEQINEISAALSKAQGQIRFAEKDGTNPHFKSTFASLASHLEVCQEVLDKHGLSVTQLSTLMEDGKHILVTILSHSSGQWFKSYYPLNPMKNDPQGMGSCLTYARRYMLSAIVGTAASDDDGEAACDDRQKKRDEYVKKPNTVKEPVVVNVNTGPKIDAMQALAIAEALSQTDEEFMKSFNARLLASGLSSHNDLPADKFVPTLQWIKINIERIKNQQQV